MPDYSDLDEATAMEWEADAQREAETREGDVPADHDDLDPEPW